MPSAYWMNGQQPSKRCQLCGGNAGNKYVCSICEDIIEQENKKRDAREEMRLVGSFGETPQTDNGCYGLY